MNLDDLKRLFPNASAATIARNCPRLCSAEQECLKGQPLVSPVPRKEKSRIVSASCSGSRIRITYRIFAQRPLDWDNYHTKCLQDLLVQAGILPDDKWNLLEGTVISEKVDRKEDERTEIEVL